MITEITAYILKYCRYRQDKPLEGKWRRKFDREATMEESSAANRSISNTFCSVMVIVKAKEQLHWNHLQVSLSGGGILRFITAQCLVSCNCSLLGIARNSGHQTVFARTACCCPSITRACVRACVCACVCMCVPYARPHDSTLYNRCSRRCLFCQGPVIISYQAPGALRDPPALLSVIYLLHIHSHLAGALYQTSIRCKSLK